MNAAATLANLRVRVIAGDPFVRDALRAALAELAGIDIVETRSEPSPGGVDADVTLWDLGLRAPRWRWRHLGGRWRRGKPSSPWFPSVLELGRRFLPGRRGC